jgi:hypothetical protein
MTAHAARGDGEGVYISYCLANVEPSYNRYLSMGFAAIIRPSLPAAGGAAYGAPS